MYLHIFWLVRYVAGFGGFDVNGLETLSRVRSLFVLKITTLSEPCTPKLIKIKTCQGHLAVSDFTPPITFSVIDPKFVADDIPQTGSSLDI